MEKKTLPLGKALLFIFFSTLLVSGSASLGWFYYSDSLKKKALDNQYNITAIIQTGPQKEALKTLYLAELLQLSTEKTQNLYLFDIEKAEEMLRASPVIKSAQVQKSFPSALYIDYSVHLPIAYLLDYENSAIDKDGTVFPFSPYFTPKMFSEIYLGLSKESSFVWGEVLENKDLALAIKLLEIMELHAKEKDFRVKRVDVSQASAESYGQNQIVVILDDFEREIILRLSCNNYLQELSNYFTLRGHFSKNDGFFTSRKAVLDLRLQNLAFIEQ